MKWIFPIFLIASLARADEVFPSPEGTNSRFQPNDDGVVAREYEYKKRYTSEAERNADLQAQIVKAREGLAKVGANPAAVLTGGSKQITKSKTKGRSVVTSFGQEQNFARQSAAQSFLVTNSSESKSMLPTGSFVKAKVMSGVEAGQDPLPMLLQLDFAFTGPESHRNQSETLLYDR